ncbi:TPA: hypothetical protein ACH3X1_003306 [Trebouxia sp. C0004]
MQLALSQRLTSPSRSRDRSGRSVDRRISMATGPGAARTCIVGLGDPVVDVLVKVSSKNLEQLGLQCGGSVSLHKQQINELLKQVADDGHRTNVHGGSAANVLKGLGNLALQQRSARFMGMVGLDDAGRQFHDHFKQQHVDPLLLTSTSGKATATCLCLLTPDGERTMRTHLGASSELDKAEQLPEGWTNNCRLLHCEGYCLYKPELTRGAMQAAKAAGAEVCLDTASFEVVRNCWQTLLNLLEEGLVDLLLCNADEALAVAEMAGVTCRDDELESMEAAQRFLLRHCKVCISCIRVGCDAKHIIKQDLSPDCTAVC